MLGRGGSRRGSGGSRSGRRSRSGFGLGSRSGLGGGGAGAVRQGAQQGADFDRVAFGGDDLGQGAGLGRVDFQSDLVGFQLQQRLVQRYGVADVLQPFRDRRFRDRLAQNGDRDFQGHDVLTFFS